MFYLNGKSYLHVSRLSSVESRLPPIHVVEVNRLTELSSCCFLLVLQIFRKSEVTVKKYIIRNGIYRRFTEKD